MTRARFQFRSAKRLLEFINEYRPRRESYYRHCLNVVLFACFAPLRLLDWLRISRLGHLVVKLGLVRDRNWEICKDEQVFAENRDLRREARLQATMEDANHTWTMDMAFYVLSGGCVHRSKSGQVRVLRHDAVAHMSRYEPWVILPVQQAVLQHPGKANTISKTITCVQALWFCTQCITRIAQGLAISLLELNTFSHCISALLIYTFWWHKPYDVESHVYVESPSLDLMVLLEDRNISLQLLESSLRVRTPNRSHGPYLIVDENSNRLFQFRKFSSGYSPKLRLAIPGTGWHLISNDSDLTVNENAFDDWRKLWRAWLQAHKPVPIEPLSLARYWFADSTFSMSYLNMPGITYESVVRLGTEVHGLQVGLIMTITFAVYGGLHLLAWQYSFTSKAERHLWQISTVITMSTGLILPWDLLAKKCSMASIMSFQRLRIVLLGGLGICFKKLLYLFILLIIASRAFLVIESFIALPNSPPSTYIIPTWSAYIPHI